MRAKNFYATKPPKYEVANLEFNALVKLREHIKSVGTDEEEKWECDEYEVRLPKSKNLESRVKDNFASYLANAKIIDEKNAETEVRAKRNALLAESDAMMVSDRPSDKEAWAEYRQALRDITKQAGFPYDVEFPAKP